MWQIIFIFIFYLSSFSYTFSQIKFIDYFPIEEGLNWDYNYNTNSTGFIKIGKIDSDKVYFYFNYKLSTKSYAKFHTQVYYLKNDSLFLLAKGTYLFESNINFWKKPILYFPTEFKIGSHFISSNEDELSYEVEIVETLDEIEVLKVKYYDILVTKSRFSDDSVNINYYAKGKGLIKLEELNNNQTKILLELKTIKKT